MLKFAITHAPSASYSIDTKIEFISLLRMVYSLYTHFFKFYEIDTCMFFIIKSLFFIEYRN